MMISVLIAGSYTPICLLVLKGRTGIILLSIVWGIAVIEMLIKAFWVFCPKWVSSVLYIGMGWTCVLAFTQILNALSPAALSLIHIYAAVPASLFSFISCSLGSIDFSSSSHISYVTLSTVHVA